MRPKHNGVRRIYLKTADIALETIPCNNSYMPVFLCIFIQQLLTLSGSFAVGNIGSFYRMSAGFFEPVTTMTLENETAVVWLLALYNTFLLCLVDANACLGKFVIFYIGSTF